MFTSQKPRARKPLLIRVSQTNPEQEAKQPVSFQGLCRAQFSSLGSTVNSQVFWKIFSAFLFLPSLPVWFVGQLSIVDLSRLPVVNLSEESTKLYVKIATQSPVPSLSVCQRCPGLLQGSLSSVNEICFSGKSLNPGT